MFMNCIILFVSDGSPLPYVSFACHTHAENSLCAGCQAILNALLKCVLLKRRLSAVFVECTKPQIGS